MKTSIIRASLFTPMSKGRWGLPLLCWAEPGVAKTSIIEEIAVSCGLPVETLSPGERGEGAFGVVPVPDNSSTLEYLGTLCNEVAPMLKDGVEENEAVRLAIAKIGTRGSVLTYPAPDWATTRFPDGRGIVFVDEITTAAPAIQPPLMGLFLARRVGSYQLPNGVRVIAAANPPELAAGGFDLAPPVANRMGHIDWKAPTVDEHAAYMMRGSTGLGGEVELDTTAAEEEARVLEEWPQAFAQAVGIEVAFLRARPALKNQCPKPGDPKASRAWASDRTWEMATRALASAQVHKLSAVDTEEYVSAFVGTGNANELFTFRQAQDLPDPVALLEGRVEFKHEPKRLDRTIAVLSSCTSLVTPKEAVKRVERTKALWTLIEKVISGTKSAEDIVIPQVIALIDAQLHAHKEAAKVLGKIQPVLNAADIKMGSRR